jgi:hypothetical protein
MRTNVGSARRRHCVVAWRRTRLLAHGFPLSLATTLAHDARYDLHALIELVEQGCPPPLAVRILAPDSPAEVA